MVTQQMLGGREVAFYIAIRHPTRGYSIQNENDNNK